MHVTMMLKANILMGFFASPQCILKRFLREASRLTSASSYISVSQAAEQFSYHVRNYLQWSDEIPVLRRYFTF